MIKLKENQYEIAKKFFDKPQFHMTKSAFQNIEGDIFVNSIKNPLYACVLLKSYCFINGEYSEENAQKIYDWLPNRKIIINVGTDWEFFLQRYYNDKYEKYKRYVMDIPEKFNTRVLDEYIKKIDIKYELKDINEIVYNQIKSQDSFCTNIAMTENYQKNGIGICCIENDKIVGVVTSNIYYKDGIEINIKVNPEKRRQGIASAISAKLILKCLELNKKPYWDAANENSVGLATKLGYKKKEAYNVYLIK